MPQPMMRPKTYIHLECYLTKDYIQWYSNRRKSGKVPIEPENSLSCALQIELAKYIEGSARHFGCQFIIATHSHFLLAMEGAKIYNLDGDPATISKFWELPNMKLYNDLFKKYEGRFNE